MISSPYTLKNSDRCCPIGSSKRQIDVLLLDAHVRQALACMRSYGRSGLRVGAVVCESDAWQASNLKSRWCSFSAIVPDFERHAESFASGLLELLDEHSVGMLLPMHDGAIAALSARRGDFERRTTLPLASATALDIAVSKARTLALAAELGIRIPRSIPITDLADIPDVLDELGCPVVIKPIKSWVERDGIGARLMSTTALSADEAKKRLEHVLEAGGHALIQEWLPGTREAISLFYAQNRFWARFAQVSYREFPPLGGASVLCESIPLPPGIVETSERLVRSMNLEGCSMVEFRRDRDGCPVLMEVNPRLAGSVGLAIAAGVNFPLLLHSWATGQRLQEIDTYRSGQRLRWIEADLGNLECSFRFKGHPDVPSPGRAVTTFLSDFILHPSPLNFADRGDLKPDLAQIWKILRVMWRRMCKFALVSWLVRVRKGKAS